MGSSIVQTEFVHTEYGKSYVKLLALRREGSVHYIKEVEVNSAVTLNNQKDYLHGDNSDIVATDSQKNTVYILARKYGIENIETFAIRLCNHYLQTYNHVVHTHVYVQQLPWKRIQMNGKEHVHAFIMNRDAVRYCDVTQARREQPKITAGINDLRILKTTQSSFVNFVDDEYRTLPDAKDRLFCTVVQAKWSYSSVYGFDFCKTWNNVKDSILAVFAGPPETGEHSLSVQKTIHDTAQVILDKIPQIEQIQIILPNVHYFNFDFSRFPRINFKDSHSEVFAAGDKPSGVINATIRRREKSRL